MAVVIQNETELCFALKLDERVSNDIPSNRVLRDGEKTEGSLFNMICSVTVCESKILEIMEVVVVFLAKYLNLYFKF